MNKLTVFNKDLSCNKLSDKIPFLQKIISEGIARSEI